MAVCKFVAVTVPWGVTLIPEALVKPIAIPLASTKVVSVLISNDTASEEEAVIVVTFSDTVILVVISDTIL
jgi:hypothetical protein